ncbi:MAG: GNAT family N-acetyltransferase [Candidatus Eremiobacteraeota bacterium]|nr:GNAT family N-acetyltransferase [Candidatus Eremiobacteraeota bacterium]
MPQSLAWLWYALIYMFDHRLVSARLVLEPIREGHAEIVFERMSDARLWQFFLHLRPSSVDDLRALYRRWQAGGASDAPGQVWENWLCLLHGDLTAVGSTQATILPDGTALIAYATYTDFQRQGYAREAVQCVVSHLEQQHSVRKIIAEMDRRNAASIGLARSLGFVLARDGADENDIAYELTT